MSDITTVTTVPTTTDTSKAKRTRVKRESFTVGDLATARAKQRGISADKAAKEVRGILRANFNVITKLDPSITKVKDRANDGNRWPAMNANVREYVLDRSKRAAANAKYATKK
jgi:hypothetical protein